jgi:lysozyme
MNKKKMIAQLRLHEGERLKPYRCTAGKLTIGVGRNLDDRGITSDESAYLLSNDIDSHWSELIKHIPWVETLDDIRQRVMLDMAFNMGIFGLLTFHRTLGHIKAGNYALASSSMLESLWARQVGQRARRLATMMKTGQDYAR